MTKYQLHYNTKIEHIEAKSLLAAKRIATGGFDDHRVKCCVIRDENNNAICVRRRWDGVYSWGLTAWSDFTDY